MITITESYDNELIRQFIFAPGLEDQVMYQGLDPTKYQAPTHSIHLLGYDDGEPLGCLVLSARTSNLYDAHFSIMPKYFGTGKSVELVHACRDWILSKGLPRVKLLLQLPKTAKYAQTLAYRIGAHLDGTIKRCIIRHNGQLDDCYIFTYDINQEGIK